MRRKKHDAAKGGIMRIWIIFIVLCVFALIGCGQNPHILGPDLTLSGPIQGPDPEPARRGQEPAAPLPSESGKSSDKKGEDKRGDHESCHELTYTAQIEGRILSLEESKTLKIKGQRAFFTDVEFLAHRNIARISSAWLIIEGTQNPSKNNIQPAICLASGDYCVKTEFDTTKKASLNLLTNFKGTTFQNVFQESSTLLWAIPEDIEITRAVLLLEMTEDCCGIIEDNDGGRQK
jgi:hypothetical protein